MLAKLICQVQIKREPAESPRSVHSAASLASLCHSAASLEDLGDDEITPENIIKNVRVTGTEAPVEVTLPVLDGNTSGSTPALRTVSQLPPIFPKLLTEATGTVCQPHDCSLLLLRKFYLSLHPERNDRDSPRNK